MKIAHILRSLNPEDGGTVESVRQFCRMFAGTGHQITVITLDDPASPWLDCEGADTIALGPASGGYGLSLGFPGWLKRNAVRFDLFVINGLWQYPTVAAWQALRRGLPPYLVFPHGMLDPWFKHRYPLKHLKKSIYWRLWEHRVLRDARTVVFTTEDERIGARRSFRPYRAREAVAALGIQAPSLDLAQSAEAFLQAFPELRGRRIVLFLGRIHEKKGCDLLLSAFAHQGRRDERLILVMAGPDPAGFRPTLEAQAASLGISGNILWTGMVKGSLKWGALAAAEIFVLPSHQENFGIAVVEALAAGRPVIVTDKVNIWREIESDGAGIVCRDDANGTNEALGRWLDLPLEARQTMGGKARECFLRRFDSSVAARRMIDLMIGAASSENWSDSPHLGAETD